MLYYYLRLKRRETLSPARLSKHSLNPKPSTHKCKPTRYTYVAQLGEEEYQWAGQQIFEVANINGSMNENQKKLWQRFFDIYWEYKDYNKNE